MRSLSLTLPVRFMYPKGLKTSIILNLLFILAAAMLLVDLVMVGAFRQELLKVRLETGNSLLAAAGPVLIQGLHDSRFSSAQLSITLDEASANCIVILNSEEENVLTAGRDCDSIEHLSSVARQTLETGKSISSFEGITKGILWLDRKNMLVTRPVLADEKVAGAIAVALDLNDIYQYRFKIMDLLGRSIESGVIHDFQIDVSGYPDGIYVITLWRESDRRTQQKFRVIKY